MSRLAEDRAQPDSFGATVGTQDQFASAAQGRCLGRRRAHAASRHRALLWASAEALGNGRASNYKNVTPPGQKILSRTWYSQYDVATQNLAPMAYVEPAGRGRITNFSILETKMKLTQLLIFISTILLNFSANAEECKALESSTFFGNIDKYQGECKNGLAHGSGSLFGEKANYIGKFESGHFNGNGKITHKNGWVYEGKLENGKIQGEGVAKWPSGESYSGEFLDYKRNGFGVMVVPKQRYESFKKPDIPGRWEGGNYVLKGMWKENTFTMECKSKNHCDSVKTEKIRHANQRRLEREKNACDNYYYGRVGSIKGRGLLATKDEYMVISINKEKKMVTVKGTSGGNTISTGAIKELSCIDLLDLGE